jgi:hypothetical protein
MPDWNRKQIRLFIVAEIGVELQMQDAIIVYENKNN